MSGKKTIHLEERCPSPAAAKSAAVIFLHGSGGPDSVNLPYRKEEDALQKLGYCVFILHYLEATPGYPAWVQAVEDAATYITASAGIRKERIALVGYSLGASVALAASAKSPVFGAIVEFSGSLPDEYLPGLQSFPPLLIIHGRNDSIVPLYNAIQLAKLCVPRHLTCQQDLLAGEGHIFTKGARAKSGRELEQFLAEYLTPP